MKLFIKSSASEVPAYLHRHDIPSKDAVIYEYTKGVCVAVVEDDNLERAVDWFGDSTGMAAPFPTGTLLWYTCDTTPPQQG